MGYCNADYAEKRRILEIVCLNCRLDGVSHVPTMRKPFNVLVEGLDLSKSRGDCRSFEPALDGFIETLSRPGLQVPHLQELMRLIA